MGQVFDLLSLSCIYDLGFAWLSFLLFCFALNLLFLYPFPVVSSIDHSFERGEDKKCTWQRFGTRSHVLDFRPSLAKSFWPLHDHVMDATMERLPGVELKRIRGRQETCHLQRKNEQILVVVSSLSPSVLAWLCCAQSHCYEPTSGNFVSSWPPYSFPLRHKGKE